MDAHENDPGQAGVSPVELEIHSPAIASDAGLSDALATIDSSQLATVTLLLADLPQQTAQLVCLARALPQWPALHTVNIRWISCSRPDDIQPLIELHHACQRRNVGYRLDFVIDSRADGFAALAGADSTLQAVLVGSRLLRQRHIEVRWLLPLTSSLVYRIESIYLLARDEDVEPLLVLPEFWGQPTAVDALSADENLFVWDFISYRLLETELVLLRAGQRAYYRAMVGYLNRGGYGATGAAVAILSADTKGIWQASVQSVACAGMRAAALGSTVSHDESTTPLARVGAQLQEIGGVLLDGGRAHLLRAMVGDGSVQKLQGDETFRKVLLIGAYGGEHIGDAAILGGVLCRIRERFDTTEVVLMTQRPNHTRHLIPMLDVPVSVSVDAYERPQIQRYLAEVDCVVFAGGPLIDLPKQLVRHLYTVSLARKLGKPFVAEGIGPGPFARLPSKFTARRLMEMASRISLRTSDSAEHDVVKGLDVEVGHCPSFDYLATRGPDLSRLPQAERGEIEQLLAGTKGRPVIGINIRPIRHLYTAGAPDRDIAAYTRRIESRFEHRFVEGLRAFHQQSSIKPCYVFFPMNAIQFGSSDILSAYRLQRIFGSGVDFRVWQADASLDGTVALLRRLDVAITMRFHATIFALSQNCKVIGVDYRIGKRDKVAELLDDAGQGENCARIDLLTEDWLAQRLAALTRADT